MQVGQSGRVQLAVIQEGFDQGQLVLAQGGDDMEEKVASGFRQPVLGPDVGG